MLSHHPVQYLSKVYIHWGFKNTTMSDKTHTTLYRFIDEAALGEKRDLKLSGMDLIYTLGI